MIPEPPAFSQIAGVPPGLTPNGVPYREPDYQHASGRSGEATLTARALINKDGTTDLEVTTGDFEGTSPPYDITKLQVKLLDDADEAVWTDNRSRLATGFAHSVYDDLNRHDRLQVQGNVDVPNASGKQGRTGVVTIVERVNLRPDLAAAAILGPDQAFVNTDVVFTGYIAELNGDLSAAADCVFSVDGAEVTRADGIWVGEGDEVTCVMSHRFTEAGTYTVAVAAEAVDPGDYDLSNNSTATTIEIVEPVHQLHGSAWADEHHYLYHYARSFASGNSLYYYNTHNERHETRASFYGATPEPLTFPTSLAVVQSSGGAIQDAINEVDFGGTGTGCRFVHTGKSTIIVCTGTGGTSLNVVRNSGEATYFTLNWHMTLFCIGWGCFYLPYFDYYVDNSETWDGGHEGLESDYTFDVLLVDGSGRTFKADRVGVSLLSYDNTSYFPYGYERWWGKEGSTTF